MRCTVHDSVPKNAVSSRIIFREFFHLLGVVIERFEQTPVKVWLSLHYQGIYLLQNTEQTSVSLSDGHGGERCGVDVEKDGKNALFACIWQQPLRALLSVLSSSTSSRLTFSLKASCSLFVFVRAQSRCPRRAYLFRMPPQDLYDSFMPPLLVSASLSHAFRASVDNNVAYKAKSKKVIETDDLFGSLESEDLFATETTEVDSTPSEPASPSKTSKPSAKIDYAKRFQEKLKFLSERNGKSPAVHDGKQVRDSIWLHLIGNATTQEDLEKVAEQFRPWKDSGREIKPRVIDLFVGASPYLFSSTSRR